MSRFSEDDEIARSVKAEAERQERLRAVEARRREQAKDDALGGKPLPADRHLSQAPADRVRRPRRPGDYSASRTGFYGI